MEVQPVHHGQHPLLKSYCSPTRFHACFQYTVNIFSPFHFDRLELLREPLNCPVDRNILIRDKVGDLLHCRSSYHAVLTGGWPGAVPEPAYSFSIFYSLTNTKIYS